MKRSKINPISPKRSKQLFLEASLKNQLYLRQKGLCGRCKKWFSPLFMHKHEKKRRSAGGDVLDIKNCELLCWQCHAEVTQNVDPKDKGVHRE